MKSYRELEVWQRSCDLVIEIYKLTATFPANEQYGLISQMRRAVISIPSNIAEGFPRRTSADNHNFVRIAFASGAELETQIYLAEKLKLSKTEQFKTCKNDLEVIMKMLNKLGQSLASN